MSGAQLVWIYPSQNTSFLTPMWSVRSAVWGESSSDQIQQTLDSDAVNLALAEVLHVYKLLMHVHPTPEWGDKWTRTRLLGRPTCWSCSLCWPAMGLWSRISMAPKRTIQTTESNSFLPRNLDFSCCCDKSLQLMDRLRWRLAWLPEEGQPLQQVFNGFSSMGIFVCVREERKKFFRFGEKSTQRPGCSKIPDDASPGEALRWENCRKPLVQSVCGSLIKLTFLPSYPGLQLPCVWAMAAYPNQQLNPPFVCVADDKCMEDILCCLGKQGTYFDWCSVVEKNELGWNYNGGPADWKGIY